MSDSACPFCAEAITPDAVKCASCGESLAEVPSPKGIPVVWIVVAALVPFLICIGVALFQLVYLPVKAQAEEARATKVAADQKAIATALQLYRVNTRSWPERFQDLWVAPAAVQGWKGPYLDSAFQPPEDPWGRPYIYRKVEGGWQLISCGRDSVEGTADDIVTSNQ